MTIQRPFLHNSVLLELLEKSMTSILPYSIYENCMSSIFGQPDLVLAAV